MLLASLVSALSMSLLVSAASVNTTAGNHCPYVPSQKLSVSVGRYTTGINGTNAYNVARLEVPPASSCGKKHGGGEAAATLACVRKYIDAIDLQMSYLLAHRADQALLAAHLKHEAGETLDAPARDVAVGEHFGRMVEAFGGTAELGRQVGSEIVGATLALEKEAIKGACH